MDPISVKIYSNTIEGNNNNVHPSNKNIETASNLNKTALSKVNEDAPSQATNPITKELKKVEIDQTPLNKLVSTENKEGNLENNELDKIIPNNTEDDYSIDNAEDLGIDNQDDDYNLSELDMSFDLDLDEFDNIENQSDSLDTEALSNFEESNEIEQEAVVIEQESVEIEQESVEIEQESVEIEQESVKIEQESVEIEGQALEENADIQMNYEETSEKVHERLDENRLEATNTDLVLETTNENINISNENINATNKNINTTNENIENTEEILASATAEIDKTYQCMIPDGHGSMKVVDKFSEGGNPDFRFKYDPLTGQAIVSAKSGLAEGSKIFYKGKECIVRHETKEEEKEFEIIWKAYETAKQNHANYLALQPNNYIAPAKEEKTKENEEVKSKHLEGRVQIENKSNELAQLFLEIIKSINKIELRESVKFQFTANLISDRSRMEHKIENDEIQKEELKKENKKKMDKKEDISKGIISEEIRNESGIQSRQTAPYVFQTFASVFHNSHKTLSTYKIIMLPIIGRTKKQL